jgi:hypothetical protein
MSDKNRFEEIMGEIAELADEAVSLVPDHEQDRAKGYWYAHIMGALGGDYNHYLGGSVVDMSSSLRSFDDEDEDDWEDDEDEDCGIMYCEEDDCDGCTARKNKDTSQ